MLQDFATWRPEIKALLSNTHSSDIWALFNHRPARTFFSASPRICLVGDAAHASTPHQGAGAGMCVEDCYILSELLGEARGVEELERVFKAYDEVRRPRALKLVETSREGGMLYEFQGPEGDDMERIEKTAIGRMGWIWDKHIREDLETAREIVRGLGVGGGGETKL
jgi:salicylate hydroxylase